MMQLEVVPVGRRETLCAGHKSRDAPSKAPPYGLRVGTAKPPRRPVSDLAIVHFVQSSVTRQYGSPGFWGEKERRHSKGAALFRRATRSNALRRPDGAPDVARRTGALHPALWVGQDPGSRIEAL